MADIIIFGTGDAGRIADFYFRRDTDHRVVAFSCDAAMQQAGTFLDLPLVAIEHLPSRFPPERYKMFVAIGYSRMNRVRAAKYEQAKRAGYELVSYVSSKCTWLADHPPGDNCFILEDNTIQPFVRIGSNVTLWSGNHIGHDSVIEDHVFITSHVVVSGHCRIGSHSFLGVNATLRNGITVGARTLIGAGAAIMKDTPQASVFVPPRAEMIGKTSDEVNI